MGYELAQVNIGRMRGTTDSLVMKDFMDGLAEVNAAAEGADGFVWRLTDGVGDGATGLRFWGDEWLIVNMSVWTGPEALKAYVYGEVHRPYLRRRREWFEHLQEAVTALWWVPAGERPTVRDAEERLTLLREQGPTPEAFTLKAEYAEPA
ncbi:DUF3291 domain-containing protein [Glycomyces scopariae]|uniref:DUF3291 domain-containing protein n=1 Tax=Glycomyces sambucus TaxID=380244 RepID=A0A1G9DDZ5_9ACTN|nr:DUF3291 domain-containing protein [Glycomyces sambucus]SDK62083.1 protein of unknown function [Glycomyces sambucus]